MYTQCPECRTIFEIDEDALQASLGIVHCGKCAKRFDALRSLSDSLPADPDAPLVAGDAEPKVLTLTSAVPASERNPATRRNRRYPPPPPPDDEAQPPIAQHAEDARTAAPPLANTLDADLSASMHADLTAALIADAAGIPADAATPGDDWLLTDTEPRQARFVELDIIPLTPGELSAIEAERGVPPATRGAPDSDLNAPNESDLPASIAPEQPEPATTGDADDLQAGGCDATPGLLDSDREEPSPTTNIDAATASEAVATTPIYIRPRQRWFAHAGLWWALGCIVLALMLAAQLAWVERAALVRNPQTRPWVSQICSHLNCRLPLIQDLPDLELVSRDIRPDPGSPGALVITATVRNDAAFRQPWPVVAVALSDLDGNPVAMRRFRPIEYMPDAARRAAGIAPGATAAVAFEVADPGKRAVNFQFGFE